METNIQNGFLMLADISGYTEFIEHSELAHAPLVLNHIITFLTNQLTPTMELAEIEGDAVFLYMNKKDLSRGELLMELVEATYMNFRDRRRTMMYNITCPCKACQAVSDLDLKFIIHFGEYALQEVAGKLKPIGSCVNLAHRLLKNSVRDITGWEGYALFSEACLAQMDVQPEDLLKGSENYPHIGTVNTNALNLDSKYSNYLNNRRIRIKPDEAHISIRHHFSAAPAQIWDWLNDPDKRNLWNTKSNWIALDRPGGRTGITARNHCTASNTLEHILDWRPFDYFTVSYKMGFLRCMITNELDPVDNGTTLTYLFRLESSLPQMILRLFSRFINHVIFQMDKGFRKIEDMSGTPETRLAKGIEK